MLTVQTEERTNNDQNVNVKRRAILAQLLAGSANSLLFMCVGAATCYPSVVVAGLTIEPDVIKASQQDISWLGSVSFICQTVGSLMGGLLVDPLGRKKAMLVVCIPHVVAWAMIWYAQNVLTLYIAFIFLGLGTGSMKAPISTYIGEICTPSIRGVVMSFGAVFPGFSTFVVYFAYAFMPWRAIAGICFFIPLLSFLTILMIPETPIWYLSRGRKEEALKALCWLRGWVEPEAVKKEFEELNRYNDNNYRCTKCEALKQNTTETVPSECPHSKLSKWQRFKSSALSLTERATIRPLILSCIFFIIVSMAVVVPARPNIVNLFTLYNLPIASHWALAIFGAMTTFGAIICTMTVKIGGKRPIVLLSVSGVAIGSLGLAAYAYQAIPPGTSSFIAAQPTGQPSYVPLVFFAMCLQSFVIGVAPMAWILISEIFPYKTRGNATGIASAFCYLCFFISAKTYINIETSLQISGAFLFYSCCCFAGVLYLYINLPETENRSHEEIEASFAGKTIVFANDCIARKVKSIMHRSSKENNKENEVMAL